MAASGQKSIRKAVPALKESDNRFTPPEFVRAVENSFGEIGIDPCWHPASAVRARAYFDIRKGQNGLTRGWRAKLVFVNPPWSAAKKWIEKAHWEWLSGRATTVVCLVPAKTDTKLFHHVLAKDADVYFLEGRPRFSKENGTSEPTMQSVMVVIFGATSEQKMLFAKLVRGSWWLPPQRSRPSIQEIRVGSFNMRPSHSAYSCAARPSHDVHRTAICRPFAEMPNLMSL
ncbi:MAG: hypothetical protein BVN32_00175 [Proteobacteria bacterium ST_bin14]|nr:MAG: hypothetical protein BVN32_00175 [Proteobacteria bacterium ST_bin14]